MLKRDIKINQYLIALLLIVGVFGIFIGLWQGNIPATLLSIVCVGMGLQRLYLYRKERARNG